MVACYDRIVVLDSRLNYRGTVFLLLEGVVAIVEKQGVYASPTRLKDHVLAFDRTGNLGTSGSIPISLLHQFVLDELNILSIVVNRIKISYRVDYSHRKRCTRPIAWMGICSMVCTALDVNHPDGYDDVGALSITNGIAFNAEGRWTGYSIE